MSGGEVLSIATNTWYRIYVASISTGNAAMKSTILFDTQNTKGSVFFNQRTPANYHDHMWQIIPLAGSADQNDIDAPYVLRTWGSGPKAYFGVGTGPGAKSGDGRYTDPHMKLNTTVVDSEVFWRIRSWGSGVGFYLYTPRNGSSWRLAEKGAQTIMTNQVGPTDNQRFTFVATNEKIDDVAFSVVELPQTTFAVRGSATSVSTTSGPAIPTGPATATNESGPISPSSSLPKTTIIATAIAASLCALIIVGLIIYLIRRRLRKRARGKLSRATIQDDTNNLSKDPNMHYHEVQAADTTHELKGAADPVELRGRNDPVELPDQMYARDR